MIGKKNRIRLFSIFLLFISQSGYSIYSVSLDDLRQKSCITCKDLLAYMAIYPLPADPDVLRIFDTAVIYCFSKLSLISRIYVAQKTEKLQLVKQLSMINLILGPILNALRISFIMFAEPMNMRKHLIQKYYENTDKGQKPFQNIFE